MAAAPALLIGAAAFQALGAIQRAQSQVANLQSQAAASDYNAQVARVQSERTLQLSSLEQSRLRREQAQFLGRQRAAAAQSGVGLGGSNRDILERSETLAELDALNVAYEGAVRARGYTSQAELDEFQARTFRSQVGPTRRAGFLSAVGGGLSAGYFLRSGRVA